MFKWIFFFFSSRRRHTRWNCDWSSDVCSSDLTQRDTGGKPARLYALTREGEELFPKAYALVLGKLVEEIVRTHGRARAVELLRAVGAQAAAGPSSATNPQHRLAAAAKVFRDLGSDAQVQKTAEGWRLQAYGCPL